MKPIKIAAVMLLAGSLSACSSINTINGVRMGATTTKDRSFCAQPKNRILCIAIAAGAVGGVTALIVRSRRNKSTPPAPVAPTAPVTPQQNVPVDAQAIF